MYAIHRRGLLPFCVHVCTYMCACVRACVCRSEKIAAGWAAASIESGRSDTAIVASVTVTIDQRFSLLLFYPASWLIVGTSFAFPMEWFAVCTVENFLRFGFFFLFLSFSFFIYYYFIFFLNKTKRFFVEMDGQKWFGEFSLLRILDQKCSLEIFLLLIPKWFISIEIDFFTRKNDIFSFEIRTVPSISRLKIYIYIEKNC